MKDKGYLGKLAFADLSGVPRVILPETETHLHVRTFMACSQVHKGRAENSFSTW